MSAFGIKRTWPFEGHMSAFAVAIGWKADIAFLQRIWLLLTQSGHSDLQTSIFSLAILTRTPKQLNRDSHVDGWNWLP